MIGRQGNDIPFTGVIIHADDEGPISWTWVKRDPKAFLHLIPQLEDDDTVDPREFYVSMNEEEGICGWQVSGLMALPRAAMFF